MHKNNRTPSRERTDIFYNSKSKSIKSDKKLTLLAIILIILVIYIAYQFGYSIGNNAYKKGL